MSNFLSAAVWLACLFVSWTTESMAVKHQQPKFHLGEPRGPPDQSADFGQNVADTAEMAMDEMSVHAHLATEMGTRLSGKEGIPSAHAIEKLCKKARMVGQDIQEEADLLSNMERQRKGHSMDQGLHGEFDSLGSVDVLPLNSVSTDRRPIRLLVSNPEVEGNVSFIQSSKESGLEGKIRKDGGELVDLKFVHVAIIELPDSISDSELTSIVADALASGASVEVDEIATADTSLRVSPNDPLSPALWGHLAMNIREAWKTSTGKGVAERPVVCVVDTGIDYRHPDLEANIAINAAELNGTKGVDDDGNGIVDDIYGANMVNGSGDPMDDNMHGTHVAGTIGAVGNNGVGVSGVNWSPLLVPCKFLNARNSGSYSDAAKCINYCMSRGARILNHSWSGPSANQNLLTAFIESERQGATHVMSAGNNASDLETSNCKRYPAIWSTVLHTSMCVANVKYNATGTTNATRYLLGNSSNWGKLFVQVAAPGTFIESTVPSAQYRQLTGTSMAAPQISGLASLLLAIDPKLTAKEVRKLIQDSVQPIPSLQNSVAWGGMPMAEVAAQGAMLSSQSRPGATTTTTTTTTNANHPPVDDQSHPLQVSAGINVDAANMEEASSILKRLAELYRNFVPKP